MIKFVSDEGCEVHLWRNQDKVQLAIYDTQSVVAVGTVVSRELTGVLKLLERRDPTQRDE